MITDFDFVPIMEPVSIGPMPIESRDLRWFVVTCPELTAMIRPDPLAEAKSLLTRAQRPIGPRNNAAPRSPKPRR